MIRPLKRLARRIVPEPILRRLSAVRCRVATSRARRIFRRASEEPAWLGRDELELLLGEFETIRDYAWERAASARRGNEYCANM